MPEQRLEVVVVTVQVIQDARSTQVPQRHSGHDLGNLLERARPAGKGDEHIAELNHLGFALGHIARHDKVVDAVMLKLGLDKKARLNTRHVSAGIEHAIGERAHQARFGPAVYQRVYRGQKCRVIASVGTQVHGDVHICPPVVAHDVRLSAGVDDTRARGVTDRRARHDRALPNAQDRP